VRLSMIYDDVQAALIASANPNNAEKRLRGRDSDRELTEPAERLRRVRRQK
jgi:hypothetical protein